MTLTGGQVTEVVGSGVEAVAVDGEQSMRMGHGSIHLLWVQETPMAFRPDLRFVRFGFLVRTGTEGTGRVYSRESKHSD